MRPAGTFPAGVLEHRVVPPAAQRTEVRHAVIARDHRLAVDQERLRLAPPARRVCAVDGLLAAAHESPVLPGYLPTRISLVDVNWLDERVMP